MRPWVLFTILAVVAWGFWGFFSKLATTHMAPTSALIYEILGGALVGVVTLTLIGFKVETQPLGIVYALLTGMCALGGSLLFLFALSKGPATLVTGVTSLYPLLTLFLLLLVFREPVTLRQGMGMVLALVAMALVVV